jgi:FAD dependent oxidoreductase TIGR03364
MHPLDIRPHAIVVGAGIVGLALSRALLRRGHRVTLVEKTLHQQGASVRNFGMVWLIGQPLGRQYERGLRGRSIWKEMCDATRTWYDEVGSLQLAYGLQEASVLSEFHEREKDIRPLKLLEPEDAIRASQAVRPDGLVRGLYCAEDLIVDPREAIGNFTHYLEERQGMALKFGHVVTAVRGRSVVLGDGSLLEGDHVFICPGADLQTLLPDTYAAARITLCKLQMMRLAAQPDGWRMGPALCGGLSLIHYASFSGTPSMSGLRDHYAEKYPEYMRHGIHVMASQNGRGEIAIGDSHEYGSSPTPFDNAGIDRLILEYLDGFARFPSPKVIEHWHGIYAKMTNGSSEWVEQVRPGVYVVNGLGGAGMTLSFGLAEDICERL